MLKIEDTLGKLLKLWDLDDKIKNIFENMRKFWLFNLNFNSFIRSFDVCSAFL